MKRREFITLLLGSAAALPSLWPYAARAQAPSGQPAAAAADASVGQVATLTGSCSVKRGNTAAVALKVADHIFLNDTLHTAIDSALGVTFDDETTFSLSANTDIVVDKFVYAPEGKTNIASIHVARGTAAFVASLVAKTGDMTITTETVTIGVRGTTGIVEVPEAGAAPTTPPTVKLYADTDGHVGQIEVSDVRGNRLGTLTREASAFSIRSAGGGRFTAVSYQIAQAEAVRDRGVLTRLVTSHNIGRPLAIQRQQLRFNRLQQNNNPKGGGQNNRGRDRFNRNNRGDNNNQNNNAQNNAQTGAGNNKNQRFQGNTLRPVVGPKVTTTPPKVRVPKTQLNIKP